MSEIRVDVPAGLFGHETVAYVQDDGRIEVPAGMGRRTVAEIFRGDVYVSDGLLHRTKVLEGDGHGAFYSTEDAGLLSRGSLVFRIDPSGYVRGKDSGYEARLSAGRAEFLKKHGGGGGSGARRASSVPPSGMRFGSGMVAFAVFAALFLLLGSAYVFWGNVRPANVNHQSMVFTVLLIGACMAGCVVVHREKSLTGVGGIASRAVLAYVGAAFVYAVFAIVEAAINQTLTVPSFFLAVLFGPIYMIGASLPLLTIQVLLFWAARKWAG